MREIKYVDSLKKKKISVYNALGILGLAGLIPSMFLKEYSKQYLPVKDAIKKARWVANVPY